MANCNFAISLGAVLAVLSGVVEVHSTYDPTVQNVYHLFTRANPTVSQPMLLGQPTMIGSNFNATRLTGVLIHGWNSGPTSPFVFTMVPSILEGLDANVIVVDWSAGAVIDDYDFLINNNVPVCAASIARFIAWLNLETGASLDMYHIVGFEVGSHLAGMVGKNLDGKVYYVTALNPPRKGWNESNIFLPSDASYTEAIHTDISGIGMKEPCADVDFYPNGGLTQPGCDESDYECSGDRSYQYFAESIASAGFTSTRCDSVEDAMAENCESEDTLPMAGITNKTGSSGIYYLSTNSQSPFSTG